MSQDVLFAEHGVNDRDIHILLGPMSPEDRPVIRFSNQSTLAHLVHSAGFFSSVGQARKDQGGKWNVPVPPGLTNFSIGKNAVRRNFWILNTIVED